MSALLDVQQARIDRGRRLLKASDRADDLAVRASRRVAALKAAGMAQECPAIYDALMAAWWSRTMLARRLHTAAVAVLNGGAL